MYFYPYLTLWYVDEFFFREILLLILSMVFVCYCLHSFPAANDGLDCSLSELKKKKSVSVLTLCLFDSGVFMNMCLTLFLFLWVG